MLLLCACSAQRVTHIAPWQAVALSADDQTITLRYRHEGGDCGGFERVDIGETGRGVLVTVHVWQRESRVPCDTADVESELDVRLEQPLGQRLLAGCRLGDDLADPDEGRTTDTDCAAELRP